MKNISKYKTDKFILIPILLFAVISFLTIYSSQKLLPSFMNHLYLKQLLWYIIGFITIYFIMFIGNNYIYRNIWVIYILGILSLVGPLLFAKPINDARCWFSIRGIGTIQPSEFMKIILIITLAKMINKFNEDYLTPSIKDEFFFLLKVGIVVLIPSLLTFLQPDTGVVLIYLIITITMLFISGIKYRWFIILFSTLFFLIGTVLALYFVNTNTFITVFGTNFFLRVDRLLDWSNKTGYQLENGLNAIGAGGLFGNGLGNTPIYFPEPQTDFIFAVFANNFGFIGSTFLICLIMFFDIYLISIAINTNKNINKYVISGIIGMLLYQQVQNIGMTFGLLPITGITLPFISYGGSSLLSYMIMAAVLLNISNESLRYTN